MGENLTLAPARLRTGPENLRSTEFVSNCVNFKSSDRLSGFASTLPILFRAHDSGGSPAGKAESSPIQSRGVFTPSPSTG